MELFQAITKRKSVRAFLDKSIDTELIEKLLETARYTPSGVNMQPWQVAVVSGEKKKTIEEKLQQAFSNDELENMDYNYYPKEWKEPYKTRRKETGLLMYKTLEITREDKQKQFEQWKANYRAFDAPTVLYFFIDKDLEKGSYLDYGMFLQNVMLCAVDLGLSTCPQAALAQYPHIVKSELNIEDDKILLCGMALGYEDTEHIINSYRTPRIPINEFTRFYN